MADAAGGGVGLDLEQLQFSKISGAASAANGIAMLIHGGYTMANTIQAMDLEVARFCLVIASPSANHNSFISPYFGCPTALVALSGASNLLLNPLYAGSPAGKSGPADRRRHHAVTRIHKTASATIRSASGVAPTSSNVPTR